DVLVHERGGDRESQRVVVANPHDLDVLPDFLQVLLQRPIDQVLRLQDDRLEFGERRESNAERGVVGEVLLGVVQAAEVDGTLTDLAVQRHIGVDVELRAVRREVIVERARETISEAVGDAVRVADALALDDFRALLFDRRVDEFFDVDISRHGKPPTAVRRGCGRAYMAFVARSRNGARTRRNPGPSRIRSIDQSLATVRKIPTGICTSRPLPVVMMPELEEVPRLRKALGLTQTALARLSNVSQSTIVKIEKKQMNPSYDVVRRVMTSLQAELKRQEKKALVEQIQTRKVQYVEAKIPLPTAVDEMRHWKFSQMPVMHNGHPVGSISDQVI